MHHLDFSSRLKAFHVWWKPVSCILVGGIVAFFVWTLPSWGEFWDNVAQFPDLWQIPANHIPIISLTVKILSPLFIMAMITIVIWIWYLLEPLDKAQEASPEFVEQKEKNGLPLRSSSDTVAGLERTAGKTPDPEALLVEPTASVSHRHDPFTPTPPTLCVVEPITPSKQPLLETNPVIKEVHAPSPIQPEKPNQGPAITKEKLPLLSVTSQEIGAASHPLISIYLLKEIRLFINVPDGKRILVPLSSSVKRIQLLVYLAWRQGELLPRDKMLEQLFGWGLSDEEATEDKLTMRFESHKKLLRKKIREVVEQVNETAGRQLIDPDIDPFVSTSGSWGLAQICRVEDLALIDACSRTIACARTEGKLADQVPEAVKQACEQLIDNYPGDFIASLIQKSPDEFRSWQGHSSWVRKPFTLYRDAYLEALWLSGQYAMDRYGVEKDQNSKQEWCARAAQFYQTYAMSACSTRFDTKATFAVKGEHGERVGMSERAVRRCVVLLGMMGKTDQVNQIWSAYSAHMKTVSDQRWQPRQETLDDVQAAQSQTGAYRFDAQASQVLSAFAERTDDPVSS